MLAQSRMEVTLVGEVEEADAIQAVAETFGALATRTADPSALGTSAFHLFPDQPPPPVTSAHNGPADKAAVVMVWPLYVANESRRDEELALQIVGRILNARLFHRVRVELGKTYTPTVEVELIDDADQGSITVIFDTSPADLAEIVAAAQHIAAQLAAGEISQADVDEAREPLIAQRRREQESNASWAKAISASFRHPYALNDFLSFESRMKSVSIEAVRKAAQSWLTKRPMISEALPAAAKESK
jgi:zinc protease